MKRNTIGFAALAGILVLTFVLGLTGRVSLAGTEPVGEQEKGRLIGVLLTTEPLDLFDADAYFTDHVDQILQGGELQMNDTRAYQGRLYAALREQTLTDEETGEKHLTAEYVFEGVQGFPYFCARMEDASGSYWATSGDEAFTDGHVSIHAGDEETGVSLTATVYVAPTGGSVQYYFNPVFQTADGLVYAESGSGFFVGEPMSEGMAYAQKLSEDRSETADGQTKSTENTVEVKVSVLYPPEKITVVQFDAENRVLASDAYAPSEMPESLSALPKTAYLVTVTEKTDENGERSYERAILSHGGETLQTFSCRDDGICVQRDTRVAWQP